MRKNAPRGDHVTAVGCGSRPADGARAAGPWSCLPGQPRAPTGREDLRAGTAGHGRVTPGGHAAVSHGAAVGEATGGAPVPFGWDGCAGRAVRPRGAGPRRDPGDTA
ncbi:hypothetical protein GCM10010335_57070 [Streptomyces galbus]|nr:hypothetical protein GCM10010335_57070 [Streptomyces galbus]